jgi:peroxiredoxin
MQSIKAGTARVLKAATVAIILIAVLLVSGCDLKQGVNVGDTPPGFSGNDISGEFVSLSQFKGNVVVIYFWTDSCCGEKLKLLEPFYLGNKQRGLTILAINEGNSQQEVEAYAKKNRLTFSLQADEHKLLAGQYRVLGSPTVFVIGRDGKIREKLLGEMPGGKLEQLIEKQLAASRAATGELSK